MSTTCIAVVFYILQCIVLKEIYATPSPSTSYDQRQTGKYNIHVNIKDVSIIALEAEDLAGTLGVGLINPFIELG